MGRDYDPMTGRYIESDPIGLSGGVNTYAYAENNPITATDPSGLLQLSINETWNTVKTMPDGKDRAGLTLAYLPPAECRCKKNCSSWKLVDCSAVLDLQVYILAGIPPGPDGIARADEQQHLTDWENGAEVIAEAGVRAEDTMRSRNFNTQDECEQQSSNAVTKALRDGRRRIGNLSRMIWDDSGRHNVWKPPSYLSK
jgi:uncharacterized protein RhaS with RHS repeats